jgi:hypothetical protein
MCRRSGVQRFRRVGITRLRVVHIKGRVTALHQRSPDTDPVPGPPKPRAPVSSTKVQLFLRQENGDCLIEINARPLAMPVFIRTIWGQSLREDQP